MTTRTVTNIVSVKRNILLEKKNWKFVTFKGTKKNSKFWKTENKKKKIYKLLNLQLIYMPGKSKDRFKLE